MFQPAPRRHRRLPTGTMVSYAEVKSYLSKREIPQLFESLMAGLMYHRPENHIGYLQNCLEEVKANSDTKVQWSTFVNAKKRKSKEILPPLTPKKQDSFSSSWSDNSRQSTPLPPISARTRTRASIEQQDFRNTYILYHNPPPILAKPKAPVISVLGGMGMRIDELCEKVVRRLRGVVHISTCSMLKTRMTIEGFYRVTSVPACAVVDSVLQAMSMVQSAEALLVAGFPRNRGDIEEYRSRKVRMDGVVLVDFEEEALRHYIEHEVTSGVLRASEVDAELERFKQDIISVAEYYDEKELLTVVMGDQDAEEIVEDLILAVDKIIETRKGIADEDTVEGRKNGQCISPCNAIMASPDRLERPSTVEIRDATEEDIKSMEAESNQSKSKEDSEKHEENVDDMQKANSEKSEEEIEETKSEIKSDGQISANENELEIKDNEEVYVGSDREVSDLEKVKDNESVKSIENSDEKDPENDTSNLSEVAAVISAENKQSTADDSVKSDLNNNPPENSDINVNDDDLGSNKDEAPEKSDADENNSSGNHNASDDAKQPSDESKEKAFTAETQSVPLVFSFENISVDPDDIRNLIANDLEMCFINFQELMRKDENNDSKINNEEALEMLKNILQKDSVSYSNGFFVHKLPFSLLDELFVEELLKLGSLSFVCKVTENKADSSSESKDMEVSKLFNSSFSEKIRIIFVTDDNVISELHEVLRGIIEHKNNKNEATENGAKIEETNNDNEVHYEKAENNESDDKEKTVTTLNNNEDLENKMSEGTNSENKVEIDSEKQAEEENIPEKNDVEQEIDGKEEILQDVTEDSTGKDVEDLVTDTLDEGSKLPESDNPAEAEVDDTHSQASTIASAADETQRERAVLERQTGVESDAENEKDEENGQSERTKTSLIRQGTYSADEMKTENKPEEINEGSTGEAELEESKVDDIMSENKTEKSTEKENRNADSNEIENTENNIAELSEEGSAEVVKDQSQNKSKGADEEVPPDEQPENEEAEVEEGNAEDVKDESQNNSKGADQEVSPDEQPENEEAEVEGSVKDETEGSNEAVQDEANVEAEENAAEIPENETLSEQHDSPGVNADNEMKEEESNNSENPDEQINDKEESHNENAENEEQSGEKSEKNEQGNEVDDLTGKEKDNDETTSISHQDESEKPADNDAVEDNSSKDENDNNIDANTENNEINLENSTNSEQKNDECSEKNEPSQNDTEQADVNETEHSEHKPPSERNQDDDDDQKSNKSQQSSENKSENKSDEKSKTDVSFDIKAGMQKTIDNDSDSNDENITIETKAEVHAVDCVSPSASETEKLKNKCDEEGETTEVNSGDVENANSTSVKNDNSSKESKLNEINSVSIVENKDSGTLEIGDRIESERLSGKRQERNGSGILDESREPDPTEIEEPQERSSSSSRGEL